MQAFLNLSTDAANENPSYERSLRVVRDREIFSARPVVTYMRAMLFELVEACECRRSPEECGRIEQWTHLSCPQNVFRRSASNALVQGFMFFGQRLFPFWENVPYQKHHDLARNSGVWHVVCMDPPESGRRGYKNGEPGALW